MTLGAVGNGEAGADVDDRWASALQLFDEALVAGGSGSSAAPLDSSLDDDAPAEVLKARHCLERLARLQGSWADTLPVFPAAGASLTPNEAAQLTTSRAATPRHIGRFEIHGELGRGGQGVVFLAWDPKLEREVALKVPRPELLLTPDLRRRFLREGRAAAGLNHPNIVAIHEAGEEGPVCYIAQEYCRGGSLAAWLKAAPGPLDRWAAAALVLQLAEAVEQAHAHGILHRDLKPSNVLLAGDGSAGPDELHPKLTDFGLARALEHLGDETATGAILGTAAYMPPEQAAGRHEEIGRSSDVYGLGAILYELLTGRAPFVGTSPLEILQKVAADEPARPRTIRSQVPRDLEAICLRCLEKKPGRRYGTADLLADDLRRFLRGEPTLARPATAAERTLKWARRRPWIAALLAVVFLSLVTLGTTVSLYTVELRTALTESEQRRQESELSRHTMQLHLYASGIRAAQNALEVHRIGECADALGRLAPAAGDPELRDFCWGYLWHQTRETSRALLGHRGGVYAVDYSPDGRLLVSAGQDGMLRVWEAATGKLLQELSGHASEINALAFAPDGRQLATVSDKGELLAWSVGNDIQLQWRAPLSNSELYAVCYAPDSQRIAVGGHDRRVLIVSAADGTVGRELAEHTAAVFALAFWSGGQHLVSGGKDGRLLDWDLSGDGRAGPAVWIDAGRDPVFGLDFSPDERHLAVVRWRVDVLRMPDAKLEAHIALGLDDASSVRFSNSGETIIYAKYDSTWCIGEWAQGDKAFRAVAGHAGRLYAAVYSPDGMHIATAGADGVVRLWSADSAGLQHEVTASAPFPCRFVFAANGLGMLQQSGPQDQSFELLAYAWDGAAWRGANEWKINEQSDAVRCAISSDAKWVVRTSQGRDLLAWQQDVSHSWTKVGSHEAAVSVVAFVPGRNVLLSASNATLRAWDLATRKQLWEAVIPAGEHADQVRATAEVVACSVGYEVMLFDAATGRERFRRAVPGTEFHDVAITPDGRELLAAGKDRSIYRWTVPGGQPLEPWVGHDTQVERLAVHPDGRTVASIDKRNILKIWHRATGQVLLTIDEGSPSEIVFSPDGMYLQAAQSSASSGNQVWCYRSWLTPTVLAASRNDRPDRSTEGIVVAGATPFHQEELLSEALDPTFNGRGIVVTPIDPASMNDVASAVVVQPDGKIVVAGHTRGGRDLDFALVRYQSDGGLDTTFGTLDQDGKLTTDLGSDENANGLVLQPDGKIVLAGSNSNDFALVRYNADGSLDVSFGRDGSVTTAITAREDVAHAVAIQPDGKIVVAGRSHNGSNTDFTLARYQSDGSLDSNFDGDGIATAAISADNDCAFALAIQPDGKIVTAGYGSTGFGLDFALARYNADGSLDTSFDGDGTLTTAIGAGDDVALDLAIQPDGKIVVAGSSHTGSTDDIALVRYNSDGSLDTSFNGDGIVTTHILLGDVALAVAIAPDGRIVAAGYCDDGARVALARYNAGGALDASFDHDGLISLDIRPGNEDLRSIALGPDGTIVAAGQASEGGSGSDANFVVVRLKCAEP